VNTEEEIKKQGFAVIDKRGQNNPIKEKLAPAGSEVDTRPVKDRKWKSVAYIIVVNQDQNGQPLIFGRGAGMATDENCFQADYLFPARWDEGFDWTAVAKQRLDTYLQCPCDMKSGPCEFHRRKNPQGWFKEDSDRDRENGLRAVPEVLEVLFKAERARQQAQRILAPRR
jgi:hypothetical protein